MPLIRPDGSPLNGTAVPAAPPTLGFIVLRQEPGVFVPMATDKGHLAFFATAQAAADTANAIANQELLPSKDQKIVTPQQKSHVYVVAAVQPLAQIQANLKDPSQLLAPKAEKVN